MSGAASTTMGSMAIQASPHADIQYSRNRKPKVVVCKVAMAVAMAVVSPDCMTPKIRGAYR